MANLQSNQKIKKEFKSEQDESSDCDSKNIFCLDKFTAIKKEPVNDNKKCSLEQSASDLNSKILDTLLIKPEIESDVEDNFELSTSDIEKEFEAFNKEDEKNNTGKTILANNTTAYKCQLCGDVFHKFLEYKDHKRNHFIEKRR